MSTTAGTIKPYSTVSQLGPDPGVFISRQLDVTFRALMKGPGLVMRHGYMRLVSGEPHPFGNFAVVADSDDLATTKEAIEPLCAVAAPAAAMFPGNRVDPPVDALLAESGFVLAHAMPAMAVEIARLSATALPAGYSFERISSGSAAPEWERRFAAGYEIPIGVAKYFSPVVIADDGAPDSPVQFFAVRKDGSIVCTSMLHLRDGVAGIYCVSTIPEERGRGLAAHATAEPLRLARALGYSVGVLQSSEMGHSVYRRLGFEDFGGMPLYVRMPA